MVGYGVANALMYVAFTPATAIQDEVVNPSFIISTNRKTDSIQHVRSPFEMTIDPSLRSPFLVDMAWSVWKLSIGEEVTGLDVTFWRIDAESPALIQLHQKNLANCRFICHGSPAVRIAALEVRVATVCEVIRPCLDAHSSNLHHD